MTKEEARGVIDGIIWMVCEGHDVSDIVKTLRVSEEVVNAVVSRLEIVRF